MVVSFSAQLKYTPVGDITVRCRLNLLPHHDSYCQRAVRYYKTLVIKYRHARSNYEILSDKR